MPTGAVPPRDRRQHENLDHGDGRPSGRLHGGLNIQITNASLLNIEGGIGTGIDNGAWISTAYLIGEIIVIPLTDYLSRVLALCCFVDQRGSVPDVLGRLRVRP